MSRRKILVADLLCGAGGSSTGCERALRELGLEMELVCVNHWGVAIETHRLNHPEARHYVQDISTVRPHLIVPEGYLDLLMASPTCTHHSIARGGKPTSDHVGMTHRGMATGHGDTLTDMVSELFSQVDERLLAMARAEKAERERDDAQREAVNLARWLHKNFYAEVTQWRPLNEPASVLSQIDNMVAGVVQRLQASEARAENMEEAADALLSAYSAIFTEGNPWGDHLRAALQPQEGKPPGPPHPPSPPAPRVA